MLHVYFRDRDTSHAAHHVEALPVQLPHTFARENKVDMASPNANSADEKSKRVTRSREGLVEGRKEPQATCTVHSGIKT